MAFVDVVISPDYAIKTVVKIILFLILPFLYCILDRQVSFKRLFAFDKKNFIRALLLGIGVYLLIITTYFLINPYFDFSNVTVSLQGNNNINKENFVFVALYISFVNSLLEEFFFRGFAFLTLLNLTKRIVAYIFSSAMFALYHISIMIGWFSPLLLIIIILGLFISGLIFNCLNEKSNNIYTSWLVHMCANFAINTIGFMLFGMI